VLSLTGTGLFVVPLAWLAVRSPGRRLVAVAVPWLVIPPVLLLAASEIHPMYDLRYVLFCLPAAAVLAGAAMAEWRPGVRIVVLALTGVVALPLLIGVRQEGARFDDLRGAARILGTHSAPGDAVLFLPGFHRSMAAAYPSVFGRLDDVALRVSPAASGSLEGLANPWPVTASRLAGGHRAWVLSGPDSRAVARQISAFQGCGQYGLRQRWRLGRLVLRLYAR
jgi:mannosyltransferase